MAHLTRIFSKMTQTQNFGPVLPDRIIRRCVVRKKLTGLKMKPESSLVDNDGDENKTSLSIAFKQKGNEESKNKFGRREEFYRTLNATLCKDINCVAGVSLTPYSVGWTRINLKSQSLTDLGSVVISQQTYQNPHDTTAVFKVAKAIMRTLPKADIFIFENYKFTRSKGETFHLLEIQLLSMLTVLLNMSEYDSKKTDRVFVQNYSVIDYLYELRLKGERISAGQKLQRMLDDTVSLENKTLSDGVVADLGCIKLNVKSNFLNLIFSSQPLRRDASAIAFFLALSFIELNKKNLNF